MGGDNQERVRYTWCVVTDKPSATFAFASPMFHVRAVFLDFFKIHL